MAGAQIQCSWAVNVGSFVSRKLRCDRNWNNYEAWREQMLCLVQSQGLVGFIDGSCKAPPPQNENAQAWRRTDWLVKGWILGALNDEIIKTVVNLDTARDVWLTLGKKFSKSSRAAPPPPPPPPRPRPVAVASQGKESHEYLALYRAAMKGDWDTAKQILEQDPEAIKVRMGFSLETALHVAVANGNSTTFVSNLVSLISDDSSLAITDGLGYSPLHVAAFTGNHHAAGILLHRYPKLLYFSSRNNKLPVHLAAEFSHRETLELLLLCHTRSDLETNPLNGDAGLLLLVLLIDADFFDMALDLVEKYHLASKNHRLVGTALKKIALKATASAATAHYNFWERLVYWCIKEETKPHSFDIENQTFCTTTTLEPPRWHATLCKAVKHLVPRMKWIHQKRLMREQALQLVKCLCKHMESLNYEDAAVIYEDTMLTAAQAGIHDVVEVIVGTFPHAIHSRYSANQTFLHLAVRNRCEKVFNLMYQTSNYTYHYSDKIDSSGNSILHLAARLASPNKLNLVSGPALQMQREIQWFQEAGKFVSSYTRGLLNNAGETAEMIFTKEHKNLKIEGEKWMKDTANSCTIAAALIATVVFAAAITVPGGNESSLGYPIFSKSSAFTIFAISDAVSLFTSTTSLLMFLSILTSRYAEQDFLYALPKRLCIGLFTLFLSILFMMVAFSSTVYLVFGRKNAWVLMAVGALACLPISSFVLLQFPLLIDVISSTYGRGIFGKQSDRPFP